MAARQLIPRAEMVRSIHVFAFAGYQLLNVLSVCLGEPFRAAFALV